MKKSNPDIITSPKGKRLLEHVTKGFYDNSYIGLWLYQVMGIELDDMDEWCSGITKETFIQTAVWSLPFWEFAYGIDTNTKLSLEYRRKYVLRKKIERAPMTPFKIEQIINQICGGDIDIIENIPLYSLDIVISNPTNPLTITDVFRKIKAIKPSHLAVNYRVKSINEAPLYLYTHPVKIHTKVRLRTIFSPSPFIKKEV